MKSIKINGLFNDASWWFRNVKINTFSHRTFQPTSECRPGKKSCLDCNRLVQMFLPRIPKKKHLNEIYNVLRDEEKEFSFWFSVIFIAVATWGEMFSRANSNFFSFEISCAIYVFVASCASLNGILFCECWQFVSKNKFPLVV